MNSLSNYIKIFFQEASPEEITLKNKTAKEKLSYNTISPQLFNNYSYSCYPNHSQNEREQHYNAIKSFLESNNNHSFFDLLSRFGQRTLVLNNQIPTVKFEFISEWREITHLIGSSVIVSAFLAKQAIENNIEYRYWAWPTVLKTNNRQLQNLLGLGLSENHFHLNGSTQIFPISWISIMNNPQIVPQRLKNISYNLYPRYTFKNEGGNSWNELLSEACYIRIKLFEKIKNNKDLCYPYLQSLYEIDEYAKRLSFLYAFKTDEGFALDYALERNLHQSNFSNNRILVGERKFMFDCFKASFSGKFSKQENNEFYYYLLVKSKLRSEMIQSNNMTGFQNFSNYQSRKKHFFYNLKQYETEAVRLSLNDTMESQNIQSMEARIMTQSHPLKLFNDINFYDRIYSKTTKHKSYPYSYILHFPKRKIESSRSFNALEPRNAKQRKRYETDSRVIAELLTKNTSVRERVCGIDACSNEIGCRPETFSTEYRFLKSFHTTASLTNENDIFTNSLSIGRTYHVGEDFLDLTDGLRAIDEVIKFLEFSHGDRLGHALALGINPKEYYSYKNYHIILPKQDLLDNLIWLFYRSTELNIKIEPLLKSRIRQFIDELIHSIYGFAYAEDGLVIAPFDLFCSWKLRGDHPSLYLKGYFQEPPQPQNQYEIAKYCKSEELDRYRNDKIISRLYHLYHFNKTVRENGEKAIEFPIEDLYINLIEEIQHKLRIEIARCGIMIECNPSSNCLISTFREYSKHPITCFNNLELEIDFERLIKCPQISVSINTDDQGVFDTSLEYEYALMASALIDVKNEDGTYKYTPQQVYKYLDSVRKMGIVQSFCFNNKKGNKYSHIENECLP